VDRSSAEGALGLLVEVPKVPRGVGAGRGPLSAGKGARPLHRNFFYYLTSKWSILVLYLSWIYRKKQGHNCKRRQFLPHTGYAYAAYY